MNNYTSQELILLILLFPLNIIIYVCKIFLYITFIAFTYITILVYLILPINHNIFSIYRFFFLMQKIMEYLYITKTKIFYKEKKYIFQQSESFFFPKINKNNKKIIIFMKISSLSNIFALTKLLGDNSFTLFFKKNTNCSIFIRMLSTITYNLQNKRKDLKKKNFFKVVFCDEIPSDKFFQQIENKNSSLFLLLEEKSKIFLLYSKNTVYNSSI